MHEILYEIEHNKKMELDYAIARKFGPDSDQIEAKSIFQKLQGIQKQIDKYLKEQNYLECFKLRDEYQAISNKALNKMENFDRYGSDQPDIETSFKDVFTVVEDGTENGGSFPIREIESKLTGIVDSFAKTENLKLQEEHQPRLKDDKIHEVIGIEKNFKHKSDVICVLSLKNGMIVSGSSDTSIRIWDPKSGKCVRVLEGHTHTVLCIIELESGYLASGSVDQTAIIWNPNNGQIVNILEGFQNPIIGLVEYDKKQLAINFNEPLLLVWNWNNSSKSSPHSTTFALKESNLSCVHKHNDYLLCGCEDGLIYKIEPNKSTTPTLKYDGHEDVILDIKTITEERFISNSTDLSMILWDAESTKILKTIKVADDICLSMNYEKQLDLLIFSCLDGKIRAVELSPEIEEISVKHCLDQSSAIYFCVWFGFKEMKLLKKSKNDSSKNIVNQVIKEDDNDGGTPDRNEEKKEFNVANVALGGDKPKINMNMNIQSTPAGAKQKVNISGIGDINKEVLEEPDIEEMHSKGM